MRYRVNAPAVASQVIGGEAILIHFDSGRYYSVEGSGADIIALLEAGRTADQIADQLAGDGPRDDVASAVARFVRELVDEGLFVAAGDQEPAPIAEPPAAAAELSPPPAASPFLAPSLTRYTDLEELLRLDPIHDVDDAGWPIAKVV
jgi:hypothetical protein